MRESPETSGATNIAGSHSRCWICGDDNPLGLKLKFRAVDGAVETDLDAQPFLQGYLGLLHGGVIAALLDGAMTNCLFHQGIQAVTGDLHVRYLHPVSCTSRLKLIATTLSVRPPLYRLRAELVSEGTTMAWAEAKFFRFLHRKRDSHETDDSH